MTKTPANKKLPLEAQKLHEMNLNFVPGVEPNRAFLFYHLKRQSERCYSIVLACLGGNPGWLWGKAGLNNPVGRPHFGEKMNPTVDRPQPSPRSFVAESLGPSKGQPAESGAPARFWSLSFQYFLTVASIRGGDLNPELYPETDPSCLGSAK